jgi:hypothetical protein
LLFQVTEISAEALPRYTLPRPHAVRYLSCSRAKQLKEKLRAEDAAGCRADRSADQEAAHAGVISVTFQGTT